MSLLLSDHTVEDEDILSAARQKLRAHAATKPSSNNVSELDLISNSDDASLHNEFKVTLSSDATTAPPLPILLKAKGKSHELDTSQMRYSEGISSSPFQHRTTTTTVLPTTLDSTTALFDSAGKLMLQLVHKTNELMIFIAI